MDWMTLRGKAVLWLKEYRYVLLVLALGIVFMLLPQGGSEKKEEAVPQEQEVISEVTLQEKLEEILSQVQGAGKVRVLLSEAEGKEIQYQTDEEERSQDAYQRDTVILSDSGRNQSGLIKQINPPKYLGAIILCQGADSASVKLALMEAVSNATGLTTDRISVMKMK